MKKISTLGVLVAGIVFLAGCSQQKTQPVEEVEVVDTQPAVAETPIIQNVQVENGTVFLVNTNGDKNAIAVSTDIKTTDHFYQYTYTKASLSPNKQFVALFAKGWEMVYLRVYDIKTQSIHDVSTENLCPDTYEWTNENMLKGIACECTRSYCGQKNAYTSTNASEPWSIQKDENNK